MTTSYTPLRGSIAERAYGYLQRHPGEWVANSRMVDALESDSSAIIQSLRAAQDRKLVERRNEGRLVFWRMPRAGRAEPEPDDDPPMQRVVPAPSRDPALTGGLLRVRSAFDLVPRPPSLPDDDGDQEEGGCRNLDAPAPLAWKAPNPDNPPKDAESAQASACAEGACATPEDGAGPAGDIDAEAAAIRDTFRHNIVRLIREQAEAQRTRFALWDDGALELRHGGQTITLPAPETRRLLDYLDRLREAA